MGTLIVGLGNPGPEYGASRHNVGFWVVDLLAAQHRIRVTRKGHYSLVGNGFICGEPVVLAKPQAFMNRSGLAVGALLSALGLGPGEMVVVHDDIDLPLSRLKLKTRGGDAGHLGVRSIIEALGTGEFRRLRVGVGRPAGKGEMVDYVLSPFAEEEIPLAEEAAVAAAARVCELVRGSPGGKPPGVPVRPPTTPRRAVGRGDLEVPRRKD